MEKKTIGINFHLKFKEITDINPSFALAKVAIAYTGRNPNKSSIEKQVFENAIPSLFYCPVVGRYDSETDDFGAHDIRVIKDKDGNIEIANATVPFGVVYGETQPYWETIVEDGIEREYLCCEVILWKRQYGYSRLAEQDVWHQSMEISVNSYIVDNDGYCIIEDMTFEALCILSDSVQPCFESASVQMKSEEAISSYRTQFSAMIKEMKECKDFIEMKFNFDNLKTKGGEENLKLTEEKIDEILKEFNYTLEQITFEITEDMDEVSFRTALEGMKTEQTPEESYAVTYKQKREALENALDPIIIKDDNDVVISETYFWVADFTDSEVFVERYIWSEGDTHNDYGRFKYSLNDSGNGLVATIEGEFELMVLQWLTVEENENLEQSRTALETLSNDFELYKQEHSIKNSEVQELRDFKQERIENDHKCAVDEILAIFEDIADAPDFIELTKNDKEKAYSFEDLTELEKECFAIRGKAVPIKPEKFNKKGNIKIPISEEKEEAKSRYGDLFARY